MPLYAVTVKEIVLRTAIIDAPNKAAAREMARRGECDDWVDLQATGEGRQVVGKALLQAPSQRPPISGLRRPQ